MLYSFNFAHYLIGFEVSLPGGGGSTPIYNLYGPISVCTAVEGMVFKKLSLVVVVVVERVLYGGPKLSWQFQFHHFNFFQPV